MSGYKPGDGGGYQWRGLWCGGPHWTLNMLQALLSQSCPVMTAFWKHTPVCVLMPPCRWERTGGRTRQSQVVVLS